MRVLFGHLADGMSGGRLRLVAGMLVAGVFGVVVEAAGYGAAWLLSGTLALAVVVAILDGRKMVLRGRAEGRAEGRGGGPVGPFTNLREKG